MSDITCCPGTDCPVKEKCYRFTSPKSEYRQSYFFEPPGKMINNKFICKMYLDNNSESTLDKLKDITNGENNFGV
jgi:hypothetical protein